MKRTIITCLFNLLTLNACFSQSTYPKILGDTLVVITPTQLKQTNLIFLEHSKLLKVDSIHRMQILECKNVISNFKEADSIRLSQLELYSNYANNADNTIRNLQARVDSYKKKFKIKNYIIGGTSVISIICILIACLK